MKIFLLFFSLCFFSLLQLNGAIYKGQRVFIKKCISCHIKKQSFIKTKTISQWEELLKNKGNLLAEIHLKNNKAKNSWEYFKSKRYTKKSHHLEDFLIEYAKDSGNVPACN